MRHLILYDGGCPLCNRAVSFLIRKDKKRIFYFAPLDGKTAEEYVRKVQLRSCDTMIFVENYHSSDEKIFIESKAVLRSFWHLGGLFKITGLLSFLPSFLFDWAYRWVAKNRYRLFPKPKKIDVEKVKERLLP